jgi:subtilisin family serine protease
MRRRYCLKLPLRSHEDDRAVKRRVLALLKDWDIAADLIRIPPLDAGCFIRTGAAEGTHGFGKVSASLALSDDAHGRVVARLEAARESGILLTSDPLLATYDATPLAAGGLFGARSRAHALIGVGADQDDTLGEGVNVAIIDEGLDGQALLERGANFGGGWWHRFTDRQGTRRWQAPGGGRSAHAAMVVRNVLAVAPAATIWDVPLLPDSLLGPPTVSDVEAKFYYLRRDILGEEIKPPMPADELERAEMTQALAKAPWLRSPDLTLPLRLPRGPWVFVNSWGVLDPASFDPDREYVTNPDHKLAADMITFSRLEGVTVDMIFAAGNCGEPTPLPRCGEGWTGPGQSILGVNAHPDVLTVGAVRADGVANGLSSQGPGGLFERWDSDDRDAARRAFEKPDVCAPSGFREDNDASMLNTGSSAAAGVVAGVVAALRSRERAAGRPAMSPAAMRDIVRGSAVKAQDQRVPWDPRLGHGIVHLPAALERLGRGTGKRR